jgi:SecD/SecF fusion protein
MKNHKFWWAFIAFLVAWSLWEINPPTSRDLIQEFRSDADAAKQDATFKKIVDKALALQKENPDPHKQFSELSEAIGTNDIRPYFPYFDVHAEDRPTYAILNILQRKAAGKIKLGLDLQGGTEFLVSLDTNHIADTNGSTISRSEEHSRLVSQAAEVLRHRVDRLGVAEPVIQPAGENHILIQLPGLSQAAQDEARNNIRKAAFLEFRLVHPQSEQLLKEGMVEPGYEILKLKLKKRDGTTEVEPLLVQKKDAEGLTGKYIKRAFPSRDPVSGQPEIDFEFDSEGADKWAKATGDHVGERMAVVLDNDIYTAPRIEGQIRGGHSRITGIPDITEAITIANILENPLETPVVIDEMREVDPTLGKDSITAGIRSAVIATLAVALFMGIYYHRCGVIANIAMILNILITLGVMCSVGTTLTLPGIAGIVLTIGMAVDANVLIYERLREEMALGKSMRGALSAAYSRAFGTIFDSHTTTLISAIILIYMGTGPVKGFGVTLTIGVALSLFTALVVTRLIFDFLLARGWLTRIGMLHVIKETHWDFMKGARFAFVASCAIIIIGMGYGIFVRGSGVMGIDFAGGDGITMSFKQKQDVDQLRKALAPIGETQIQYQKGQQEEMLQVVAPEGKGAAVTNTLVQAFPAADFHVIRHEVVGASVGVEIQKSAIIASFLSLFGILLYVAFRYEFSFSVGAVLAVVHDVLLTLGVFFLSGRQLSAPMVAAVLTIIGFSLNDKVVIFDRIREDLKLGMRGTFREVIDAAINQTLSRTIITSGTVFIATMSLFLFGGGVINDFAFTFLVGIITGTYSSIYIACALVLWWHKGERPKTASQVTLEAPVGVRARA